MTNPSPPIVSAFQPKLDPEFQTLLRELKPEELAVLTAAIETSRTVIGLVVWKETGILIDGENSLVVAAELEKRGLKITYRTPLPISFKSRAKVVEWMRRNQNGRRNDLRVVQILDAFAADPQLEATARKESQARMRRGKQIDPSCARKLGSKGNVRQILADDLRKAGISATAAAVDEALLIRTNPKLEKNVRAERMTARSAANDVRKERDNKRKVNWQRSLKKRIEPMDPNGGYENQILAGDVLSRLTDIPNSVIDLTFTSPPYPITAVKYNGPSNELTYRGKYKPWLDNLEKVWAELFRVTKDGGRVVINLDDPNAPARERIDGHLIHDFSADVIAQMKRIGFTRRPTILWYKQAVAGLRPAIGTNVIDPRTQRNWEYLLVFHKTTPRLSGPKAGRDLTQKQFKKLSTGFWYINGDSQYKKLHRAPFPLQLATNVIRFFSYRAGKKFPGSLVLDPFSGTGTTAVAALLTGRRFTGIEIDPNAVAVAQQRIKRARELGRDAKPMELWKNPLPLDLKRDSKSISGIGKTSFAQAKTRKADRRKVYTGKRRETAPRNKTGTNRKAA